jgi:hypothetical protein
VCVFSQLLQKWCATRLLLEAHRSDLDKAAAPLLNTIHCCMVSSQVLAGLGVAQLRNKQPEEAIKVCEVRRLCSTCTRLRTS